MSEVALRADLAAMRHDEIFGNGQTQARAARIAGFVEAIKDVLRATPPELSADVMQKGMMLSGGTAQLRNLERLFAEATGVPAFVADHPQLCVAKGTGIALENLEAYKRSIFSA